MEITAERKREAGLFAPEWRSLSIGALGLCSMIAFEAIGVAAGMPAVAADLNGVPFYALAFAGSSAGSLVAMVWSGHDCDVHGPFRSMAGGLLLFALGLLIAGLATTMASLVLGRVVQGLGEGALVVALYVAMAQALPQVLLPRLFALFSTAWVVPAIVGPAISGWIVEHLGWRWLFLGVAVLLIPTAALILPSLQRRTPVASNVHRSRRRLAWALLASAGSVSLALGAKAGSWAPLLVLVSMTGVVLAATRLLPAGTLRLASGLPTVIALRGLNTAAFFLCEAFVPLWLHQQRGWSLMAAGLALTGGALSWSVGSQTQSRITNEVTRQRWLFRGCLLLLVGIAVCATAVLGLMPDWVMLFGWALSGLGVGLSLPMLSVLMLKLAPAGEQGKYSSALQLCAALGTGAALAIGSLVFSLLQATMPMAAFAGPFAISAGLAAIAWRSAGRVAVAAA